ncbi:hypothetical protein ACLB2K_038285 [Fragaria x ananassa]
MFQTMAKIASTRMALNSWQRVTFGNRKKEIELMRGRLQELMNLPLIPRYLQEHSVISGKLESLLEEEKLYWRQRAKITWLTEGDKNTKYFHRKASNRRAKNRLRGLYDINVVWQPTLKGMEDVILRYYDSMFTSASIDTVRMQTSVNLLNPKVTTEMNLDLCASYTDDETRTALFEMYPTKSPGPDAKSDGVMSLKLDMSKAYDRMEWVFLEAVLLRLGFNEDWVRLVMQCVSTVSYSFFINGKPCGSLKPSRGLRQGDPLSPYLFLLCAEVFSALLEKKASMGLLQGVQICPGAPTIHHLLFADDSLLFGKASSAECLTIRSVLAEYEAASGQQGWRLVKNPSSLLGRLYKARYFPDNDFWSAPIPTSPSQCWKGIFEARDLLANGTRWQIGDVRRSTRLSQVSEFITVDKKWDIPSLEEHFEEEDLNMIVSIPLRHRNSQDKLIWHFESRGRFSTNSAYQLARQLSQVTPWASNQTVSTSFWKKLWHLGVAGKIKVHIWRVCSSILPTVDMLRIKKVMIGGGCFFCNEDTESIEHVSRDCCFIRDFAKMFPELHGIFRSAFQPIAMLDWLIACSESLPVDDFQLLLVMIWAGWKEGNSRLWDNKVNSLNKVFYQVPSFILLLCSVRQKVCRRRVFKPWTTPPVGWLKANIDGAFQAEMKQGGIGVLLRDSDEHVVGGICMKVDTVASPDTVEALARRVACELAAEFNLSPVIFESDCLKLVKTCSSSVEDDSTFGQVVADIKDELSAMPCSFFSHIFRETNSAADKQAKLALRLGFSFRWFGSVPTELGGLVASFCNP